jgi:hypothetical protein
LEDTLIPTKPEDFAPAIQTDKKLLKKEVEYILNPDYHQTNINTQFEDVISEMVKQNWTASSHRHNVSPSPPSSSQPNCTCPKRIHTKKRAKKKHLQTITTVTNGYMMNHYCPIHSS